MKKYFKLNEIDDYGIEYICNCLENGEVVACPTLTSYGLIADYKKRKSVEKIFKIKNRELDNPLSLAIRSTSDFAIYSFTNKYFDILAKNFWPGTLTIVNTNKSKKEIPTYVSANLDTIGMFYHDYALLNRIIEAFGRPIICTSANTSGKEPAFSFEELMDDLGNKINYAIDGGKSKHNKNNTVVDISKDPPEIIRDRIIPKEKILSILNSIPSSRKQKAETQ